MPNPFLRISYRGYLHAVYPGRTVWPLGLDALWTGLGLAVAGMVLKAGARMSHPIVSTSLYLLMGWLIVIAVKPLYAQVPTTPGLLWLVAGGVAYTVEVAFFATDSRLR